MTKKNQLIISSLLASLSFIYSGLLNSTPWSQGSRTNTLKQQKESTNFQSFQVELFGRQITISGMSHPGLWKPSNISLLESEKITHLLSLEPRFQKDLQARLSKMRITPYILDVEDFTPPSQLQFQSILQWIKQELKHRPKDMHLGVHCWGGNGRTGTVLAFLKMVSEGKVDTKGLSKTLDDSPVTQVAKNAIRFVRAKNPHYVESVSQIQMLNNVSKNLDFFSGRHPKTIASETISYEQPIDKRQLSLLLRSSIQSALKHHSILMLRQGKTTEEFSQFSNKYGFGDKAYARSVKYCGQRATDSINSIIKKHLTFETIFTALSTVGRPQSQSALENEATHFVLEAHPELEAIILEAVLNDQVALDEMKALSARHIFSRLTDFISQPFR